MGKIDLTKSDQRYLAKNYPTLIVKDKVVIGDIKFDLTYKGKRLKGKYRIEIILETKEGSSLPIVRETKGKILRMAKRKKIPHSELHLNSEDGELCLIIPPKEKIRYPNGFNIIEFMRHIEEHLYWLTYYDRYNKAPWKAQAHGINGYFELYEENLSFRSDVKKVMEDKLGRKLKRQEMRTLVKNNRKKK